MTGTRKPRPRVTVVEGTEVSLISFPRCDEEKPMPLSYRKVQAASYKYSHSCILLEESEAWRFRIEVATKIETYVKKTNLS